MKIIKIGINWWKYILCWLLTNQGLMIQAQTAQQVIDRFINSVGGRSKLESLSKINITYASQSMGSSMIWHLEMGYPNQMISVMIVNGLEYNREEFDGQRGFMVLDGVRTDYLGRELEKRKYTSIFNEYLYYDQFGFQLTYLGMTSNTYGSFRQIQKTTPANVTSYMYFNAQTGMLAQVTDENFTIYYSDYRPVEGILYPYVMSMENGIIFSAQDIKMTFGNLATTTSTQYPNQLPESSSNYPPPNPTIEKPSKAAAYEKKYALVIGNSKYTSAPLKNPANDARAMSAELQRLGFEVQGYTDLTRKEMRSAIHDFGDKIRASKGIGLFYYAGHGLQAKGINYLVPVDANIEREYDIEDECIKADIVLRMMEMYDNPMNIIILDACRNNPCARSFRSVDLGLAQPESAPTGSIIAFATAPGKTASDGDGENGLYTQELIKAMRQKGLSIEQVFKKVRINVLKLSDEKQSPWENSSLTGDFYFNPN